SWLCSSHASCRTEKPQEESGHQDQTAEIAAAQTRRLEPSKESGGAFRAIKEFLNFLQHHDWLLALDDYGVYAGTAALGYLGYAGKHYDGNIRFHVLHGRRHLATVHFRHGVIEQNQVHRRGGKQL